MYRKELQRACPRSQAWLLQAFEAVASTTSTTSTRRRFTTKQARESATATTSRRGGQTQRLFSTTRARTDAVKDESADAANAEGGDAASMETIVRQAKATFGDTLPPDYLTADELKLYKRLYGAPIRETHPVDVGIPRSDEDFPYRDVVLEKQNELFRETPNGYLEQVEYTADVEYTREEMAELEARFEGQFDPVPEDVVEEAEAEAATPEELLETTEAETETAEAEATVPATAEISETTPTDDILTDTQIDYIQAVAKNKRELAALMKLQRDFETSRAASLAERKADEANEAAIMEAAQQARREQAPHEEHEDDQEDEDDDYAEEEEVDEELQQEMLADPSYRPRLHPLSIQGQGRPSPSTVHMPKRDVVQPVAALLKRTDISHVRQAAQQLFGGPNLPYSAHTPKPKAGKKGTGGNQNFEQLPVALSATQRRMSPIEADVYMSTIYPSTYATTINTLVEVRKRLGPAWIQGLLERSRRGDGSLRVLDLGGGGAALAAWNQVFRSEVELLREQGVLPPRAQADATEGDGPVREEEDTLVTSKKGDRSGRFLVEKAVVVGNEELSHRASQFLNNTTFLPRLPDLLHSAENVSRHIDAPETPHPTMAKRKTYDVIIATHQVMGVERPHQRRATVDNLWANLNPDGGVLIVVEKGHPRGFEAVAYARQRLLDVFITAPPQSQAEAANPSAAGVEETPTDASETDAAKRAAGMYTSHRSPGMIVAPCTSHGKCPMYLRPGLTAGRKDFCHFSQRYIRPPFLQKIMNQGHRNHEDVQFSYVAVQRGASPGAERDAMHDVFVAAMGQAPPRVMPLVQGKEATEAAFAGYLEPEAQGEGEGMAPPATTEAAAAAAAASSTPKDVPHMLTLPRVYMAPLKRRGHVVLDVCTPEGKLERWTVPRSYGKQAYHDARKASWGDLWALGGKTRIPREARMGKQHRHDDAAKRSEAEAGLRDDDDMEDYLEDAELKRLQAMTKASMVIKQKSTDNLLEHVNKNSLKAQIASAKIQAKKNKKKWDRQFKGYKGYKKQRQSRQAAAGEIMKAISREDGFE